MSYNDLILTKSPNTMKNEDTHTNVHLTPSQSVVGSIPVSGDKLHAKADHTVPANQDKKRRSPVCSHNPHAG